MGREASSGKMDATPSTGTRSYYQIVATYNLWYANQKQKRPTKSLLQSLVSGHDPLAVEVAEGATLKTYWIKADVTVESNQQIYNAGETSGL